VTDKPDSPHLLVPKMKAQFYFGIAASDDEREPDAKRKLADAFAAAHLPAKIEVYEGTLHGWCVKDMPSREGQPVYNEAQAERAWKELLALFKRRWSESGAVPVAAALANAVFAATGARLRTVPFTPGRMKAALSAAS